MTPDEFRAWALELPETSEQAHQNHPDFRVRGKVFATLGPDESWGMVKIPPEMQESLVDAKPTAFEPFAGAWGKRGCTRVTLAKAPKRLVREALIEAWRNTAPKKLVAEFDGE